MLNESLILKKSFLAHSGDVWRVLYINGFVLTASVDTTVKIWDPNNNWTLYGTFSGHNRSVYALISISSTTFLSGGADFNVKQWDLTSGTFSTITKVYATNSTRNIESICYMSSLNLIAVGMNNSYIYLFNKTSGEFKGQLYSYTSGGIVYGHTAGANIYELKEISSNYMASSGSDATVIIWDVPNYSVKYTLSGHTSRVYGLRFIEASNILASSSWDGNVKLWNMTNGFLIRSISIGGLVFYGLEFLDTNTFLVADTYKNLFTRDFNTGNIINGFNLNNVGYSLAVISKNLPLINFKMHNCNKNEMIKILNI